MRSLASAFALGVLAAGLSFGAGLEASTVAHGAQTATAAADAAPKNVLMIYSYGHGSRGIDVYEDGLISALNAGGVSINQMHFEYLDLERHPGVEHRQRMRDLLLRKYAGKKIDLILTVQHPARNFLLHEGQDLAPQAPASMGQTLVPTEARPGEGATFYFTLGMAA